MIKLIPFEEHQEEGVGISVDFFDLQLGQVLLRELFRIQYIVEEEIIHFKMIWMWEDIFE